MLVHADKVGLINKYLGAPGSCCVLDWLMRPLTGVLYWRVQKLGEKESMEEGKGERCRQVSYNMTSAKRKALLEYCRLQIWERT